MPGQQSGPAEGLAIASLVLGIVPVLGGALGVVFGVSALRRIGRTGSAGRGMAIAGTVLGALWLTLIAVVGVGVLVFGDEPSRPPGTGVSTAGDVLLDDLKAGDCVRSLPDEAVRTLLVVPCDAPHRAEVYSTFDLEPAGAGARYPGEDEVDRLAGGGCDRRAVERGLEGQRLAIVNFSPDEDDWEVGDRKVICLAETEQDTREPRPSTPASRGGGGTSAQSRGPKTASL